MKEFRLMHPSSNNEHTFAIKLAGDTYFPVLDHRYNVCTLQQPDGGLAQWYRYSSFGDRVLFGQSDVELFNPWRFANRRGVDGLSLFLHRCYHP